MIETGDTAMATLEKVWRRKDYVKDPSLSSTQSECAEDAEDELDSELDADPTDENFMYNKTDILFCQHDLFRGSFDKTEEQVMAVRFYLGFDCFAR
uniref:snRNA-activating protein complex subunit 3 n=1 Tax=Bursaphelenchus xylophilus TaxID=6326 RepID=A0A1I7SN29_BURXY